ncbi:nucleotidyl transferase AbiEii/AbiGii toxin family protein [Bradyrhizobium sp. Cp5.3]|uniref:nucleotidyl transferase AbiEii/AbiGii toxin family protein n=1 Tax=Bradyrhizobium sp. Cp5.3 TaxID=443598 RepID=UPI000405E5EC|nr:nucleotidyl transferase AbiEii/AbiGii toxin family protein [Bradyrhizobium sp. Cp5.3]
MTIRAFKRGSCREQTSLLPPRIEDYVDVTKTEFICGDLDSLKVIQTYPAFDFPEHEGLNVYSIDEIATKKIVALTAPKRSQPRDLIDIWTLLEDHDLELSMLALPIAQKLKFRNRPADGLSEAFDKKEKLLKVTWNTRLDPQMPKTPEFEGVYRAVRQSFRNANLFETTSVELIRLNGS